MAPVNVQTGVVDASDPARNVPPQKWFDLMLARRTYARIQLPHDCRSLLMFVQEAEEYRMWEQTGHANLDEYIRLGLKLNPTVVEWARDGLQRLDNSQPITLSQAVHVGKTAAQTMHDAPELKQHGVRGEAGKKKRGDNITSFLRGTESTYLASRLKRDHPEIAAKVQNGEYPSIRAAALDAGIIKPTRTIPIDNPSRAVRALLRVFSADELREALNALDDKEREG